MTESRNVPSVIVRNRDRSVVVTRSFTVEGAENMPAQYSGKPFRPDVIVVKLHDSRLHTVEVSGLKVLTGGRSSQSLRARRHWYSAQDLERDAPAWVRDAVATVLRMEARVR